ncbi:MAG: hypothetical protein J1F11_01970 [Oscillospiraceae bacterium]|nr:hypothetical protein [Oscillospiraceae bacterium]
MTSTVSDNMTMPKKSKSYSPVLHYWKSSVRSHSRMMVILAILHFTAAPLVLLSLIISMYAGSYDTDSLAEVLSTVGIVTTLLAGFLGIFIAINSFNCLHKRSVVDMKLSLPMTSTQRFFADFLSGLFAYLVPFLASDIVTLLLGWYGLTFMEGKTFHRTLTAADGTINDSTYICKYFTDLMPVLLKLTLCGILTMLMLYTITVLITVCCGSIFEAVTYTLLVNVVVPGTIVLMLYNVYADLYGVDFQDSILNPLTFTSVAGGFFYLYEWADNVGFEISGLLKPWLWTALYILMTFAFGAVSFFLYRKRRAEQVSKPFVFKLAYYIIITGVMFCIYSIYYITETNMVSMVVITAVSYMIFEVVTNRGFRRFWLSIIKYIVTILAAVGIVAVGHSSEGFGAVQKVPSLSSVSSVTLRYDGFYGDFQPMSYSFNEPEIIQIVLDAHSALIKNYNENKQLYKDGGYYYGTATSSNYIRINYSLKNGTSIERGYSGLNWEATEILSRLDLTNEYKTQTAEYYKKEILAVSDDIAAKLAEDSTLGFRDTGRTCWSYNLMFGLDRDSHGLSSATLYKRGFFEQLAEAYSKDIMAINEDNYYHSRMKNVYDLYITSFLHNGKSRHLKVPESFTNTIGLLDRFGFDVRRVEDVSDAELYERLISAAGNGQLHLFDESQWRELRKVPEGEVLHSSYEMYGFYPDTDSRVFLYNVDDNICDLVRAAMPRNITDRGCYTIRVFETTAGIPQELTPKAALAAEGRTARDLVAENQYLETANWD